jgi:hypothetical protein
MLKIILATIEGPRIDLQNISIVPTVSATIRYVLIMPTGNEHYEISIEGEQYSLWGNDDTIIYHLLCARHGLHYKPYQEPEFFEEIIVWKDDVSGEMKNKKVQYPNPKYVAPISEPAPTQ